MNTVIELDDVALTRGKTQILANITWNTHRGEQWVVLGANGERLLLFGLRVEKFNRQAELLGLMVLRSMISSPKNLHHAAR